MSERIVSDWADDHTHLQQVCGKYFPADKVAGSAEGVPGIQDLADMLAEHIDALVAELSKAQQIIVTLTEQLATVQNDNITLVPQSHVDELIAERDDLKAELTAAWSERDELRATAQRRSEMIEAMQKEARDSRAKFYAAQLEIISLVAQVESVKNDRARAEERALEWGWQHDMYNATRECRVNPARQRSWDNNSDTIIAAYRATQAAEQGVRDVGYSEVPAPVEHKPERRGNEPDRRKFQSASNMNYRRKAPHRRKHDVFFAQLPFCRRVKDLGWTMRKDQSNVIVHRKDDILTAYDGMSDADAADVLQTILKRHGPTLALIPGPWTAISLRRAIAALRERDGRAE